MAKELEDGCYIIAYSKNPNLVIDTYGGFDIATNNIWIHTINRTAAQIVQVRTAEDGREIYFPLTGMAMEADTARFQNGSNVFQSYRTILNNPAGNRAAETGQRWDIRDTGETRTYENSDYAIYNILCHYNNKFAIDLTGGLAQSENNIQIWEVNNTDAQKFIFIPIGTIINGTYVIRSAIDPRMVCDVAGEATGNGSNVFLSGWHDGNNQKWAIEKNSDGTVRVMDMNSGKLLSGGQAHEIPGVDSEESTNAYIWETEFGEGDNDQKLLIRTKGVKVVNGLVQNLCVLQNKSGQSRCLDAYNAQTSPGTNVWWHQQNDTLAQNWYLEQCEALDTSMSVPEVLGLSEDGTNIKSLNSIATSPPNPLGNRENTWNLYFDGVGYSEFHLRYMFQLRNNSLNWGEWSEWKDWQKDNPNNYGWGIPAISDIQLEATENEGIFKCKKTFISKLLGTFENTAYRLKFELQALRHDYKQVGDAHSQYETKELMIIPHPKVIWEDVCYFSIIKGLALHFSTDWLWGAKFRITVEGQDGRKILDQYLTDKVRTGDECDVFIPLNSLINMPEENEELTIVSEIVNIDGTWSIDTYKSVCSYTKDHGLLVEPVFDIINQGESALITFNKGTKENVCRITTVVHGHKAEWVDLPVVEETDTTITYRAYPQYGKEWQAWCFAYSNETHWGIERTICKPQWPYMNGTTFSWEDEELRHPYLFVAVQHNEYPKIEYALSADSETFTTSGREHEVVKFGGTVKGQFSISGVFGDDLIYKNNPMLKAQSLYLADKLAYAGKEGKEIILRTTNGHWSRVAVTDITTTQDRKGLHSITITAKEVSQ